MTVITLIHLLYAVPANALVGNFIIIFHMGQRNWKDWSVKRFTAYWQEFLRRPDATADPQYAMIRKMFEAVHSASGSAKSADASTSKA